MSTTKRIIVDEETLEYRKKVGKIIKSERETFFDHCEAGKREEILSKRIRKRRYKGLSRYEFAEVLSIDEDTIYNLETGRAELKVEHLYKISEVCNCDIGYLLGECENRTYIATDIHKEIGLSDDSILFLKRNVPITDGYIDVLNFLLEEAYKNEGESLLWKMVEYYFDEIDMILYSKNKWFPWFDKKFKEHSRDITKHFDYFNYMMDYYESLDEFRDELIDFGYSGEEADSVCKEVSPTFSHYYELLASETFRKINLQSEIISHLDECVLKNKEEYFYEVGEDNGK